jgi:ribose transport system permease protein
MLPFAAILAIAAIGQTLVLQQGGIDLSVPGMISLAAVIFTKEAHGDDSAVAGAIVMVLAVSLGVGLLNGLVVTRLNVTPLVATLAANALLLGTVQQVSGGTPTTAPRGWTDFANGKLAGIPNTVIIAVVVTLVIFVVVKWTVMGRRFEATGDNDLAAQAAGITVKWTQTTAYVMASLLYGCAGILLAGFLQTPSLFVGDTYLLSSIAAAVLGGAPLAGGAASVIASAIGALFISQLNQVLAATGAATSVQLLVQGGVIAVAMALTNLDWRPRAWRARRTATGGPEPPGGAVATSDGAVPALTPRTSKGVPT